MSQIGARGEKICNGQMISGRQTDHYRLHAEVYQIYSQVNALCKGKETAQNIGK